MLTFAILDAPSALMQLQAYISWLDPGTSNGTGDSPSARRSIHVVEIQNIVR
jgi:hypothetical protein